MVNWLVVSTPLKKYESRLGSLFPTVGENKNHVPNHQPDPSFSNYDSWDGLRIRIVTMNENWEIETSYN